MSIFNNGKNKILKIALFFLILNFIYLPVFHTLESNHALKEKVYTLEEVTNKVFSVTLFDVPLLICDVKVDIAVKLYRFMNIICELTLGKYVLDFCLNDLSLSYHIEQGRLQLDGGVSKFGFGSFKATVDTDGIIQGVPKLIFYYI